MNRGRRSTCWILLAMTLAASMLAVDASVADEPRRDTAGTVENTPPTTSGDESRSTRINRPGDLAKPAAAVAMPVAASVKIPGFDGSPETVRTVQNVLIFGLISLAPAAVLMVTSFVRINIVLILLRQALGSPQVPGNQVLTALALLLTVLVMRPVGDMIYRDAILPYQANKLSPAAAWRAGSQPIKGFMIGQIVRYKHEHYLRSLENFSNGGPSARPGAAPAAIEELPLTIVAPAYLLSELTTAFMMGFYLYLPFLVIDLVVSAVLAATGLFMLPPALVAMPLKLIVFVLADGWLLVANMLLSSFHAGSISP